MLETRFLYIIGYDTAGPLKIGISNNPDKRLKQLQTGQDKKLNIYHVEEVLAEHTSTLENFLHKQLSYLRKTGEWFEINLEHAVGEMRYCIIRWASDPELDKIVKNKRKP